MGRMTKEVEAAFVEAAQDDVEVYNLLMQTYEAADMPRADAGQLAILRMASSVFSMALEKNLDKIVQAATRDWFTGK